MASVVATPLPALGIVKVIVDWTPTYTDTDPITLYRVTPDGATAVVIGSPVYLSGGKAILYDTTAPFDVPITYRATITNPLVAFDDFARSSSGNGWGTATMGGTYVVRLGPTSEFSTQSSSGEGLINNSATTGPIRYISLPTAYTNVEAEVSFRAPLPTITGSYVMSSVLLRYVDALNFYQFGVQWHPGGVITVKVFRRQTSPNVLTQLASQDIGTYKSATEVRVIARVEGSSLKMKAWTGEEPQAWTFELTDTTQAGPGFVAFGAQFAGGNTNTWPLTTYYDTIRVRDLSSASLTSNSVTLLAGRDGWIRDPQDPAKSVRLDNCASHTVSCLDADRFVFFQGLDDESYDSATGVFEVIGSENPLTVAQPRKGKSTSIRLVSTTLADIPPLRRLFAPGRDLVVSLPADYGWGIESYGTEAVTVGTVGVDRLNKRQMSKPQRLWSLPVRVVDADQTYPTGAVGSNDIPVPGATYGDMKATGKTYGQLKASGKTYLDWAQGVFS